MVSQSLYVNTWATYTSVIIESDFALNVTSLHEAHGSSLLGRIVYNQLQTEGPAFSRSLTFSANLSFIGSHHYTVYALFYKDKELYRAVCVYNISHFVLLSLEYY